MVDKLDHINNVKYKVTKPSTQRQRQLYRFNVRKKGAVERGEEEESRAEGRRGERGGERRGRKGKDKGIKPIKYMMSIGDAL